MALRAPSPRSRQARRGASPSAIVRFASALGYSGFTEMQQVFRLRLVASLAPSYKDRIERLEAGWAMERPQRPPAPCWRCSVTEGIASLKTLNTAAREPICQRAIELLGSTADTIYLLSLGLTLLSRSRASRCVLRKLGQARGVARRAWRRLARAERLPRRCADAVLAISFKQYKCRYFGSSVRRADCAWRAGGVDHGQSSQPDRARRRRGIRAARHG